MADEVSYIFQPHPKPGGHGQCVVVRDHVLALDSLEGEHGEQFAAYVATLDVDEPLTLELGRLTRDDVGRVEELARAYERAVVARRSGSP